MSSKIWQFNHCVGAIDGKHVVMQAPPRSGSMFFNYKKTHSIVLMAVCDANYKFTLLDIGDSGRNSDGGVFSSSSLGIAINNNSLNIPQPETIWNNDITYPFVIVGDEAFPLKTNLLKPYPKDSLDLRARIFNYRLSRARRVIENTFGILAARFRIFRRAIIGGEKMVTNITKACTVLHNYLMHDKQFPSNVSYCPPGFVDQERPQGTRPGAWREEVGNMGLVSVRQVGTKTTKGMQKLYVNIFVISFQKVAKCRGK